MVIWNFDFKWQIYGNETQTVELRFSKEKTWLKTKNYESLIFNGKYGNIYQSK